jgi:CTP:molybdopterin cytidylyltransferase MocA
MERTDGATPRTDAHAAQRVLAVLLAAGEGRRAGGPKALLRLGEQSFLAAAAARLRRPGVAQLVLVLGAEPARVRREAGVPEGAEIVLNAAWREGGMLSSLLRGLDRAEQLGAEAVLVHPVDHPLVAVETVDRVLAALAKGARVAVPSFAGRRGHPAGFAREAFGALRAAPAAVGARAVLRDHPDWVVHVDGDPGCLAGVNTPADYARLLATGSPSSGAGNSRGERR